MMFFYIVISCFWSKGSDAGSLQRQEGPKRHKTEGIPKYFFSSLVINHHTFTYYLSNKSNPSIIMSGTYKPTEHGGLKEDGTPDKRTDWR
jgi:hypothetical protein